MTQLDLTALPPPRAETMFPGAGPDPVEAEQRDDIPVPADGLTRTLSYLTDLACVVAVAGPLWRLLYSPVLTGIAIVELVAVLTLLRARTGRTPGALISGTVAVADGSDHAPGLKRQLVRTALMVLLHVTVVGPLIVSFLSRDGRDLVDRIAGTAVLDLRSGKSRSGSGNGDEEAEEPLPGGAGESGGPGAQHPGEPVAPRRAARPHGQSPDATQGRFPGTDPGSTSRERTDRPLETTQGRAATAHTATAHAAETLASPLQRPGRAPGHGAGMAGSGFRPAREGGFHPGRGAGTHGHRRGTPIGHTGPHELDLADPSETRPGQRWGVG